jgi:hypothetical protein
VAQTDSLFNVMSFAVRASVGLALRHLFQQRERHRSARCSRENPRNCAHSNNHQDTSGVPGTRIYLRSPTSVPRACEGTLPVETAARLPTPSVASRADCCAKRPDTSADGRPLTRPLQPHGLDTEIDRPTNRADHHPKKFG